MTMPQVVIIGAGFAGASTAWALARLGAGPGVILEREPTYGVHASGRNAGLLKVSEEDPLVRALAIRSVAHLSTIEAHEPDLVRHTGGVALGGAGWAGAFEHLSGVLEEARVESSILTASHARERWPILRSVSFESAFWCACEGVVDVHALLTHYLRVARSSGFVLRTNTGAEALIVEGGRVVGVETLAGPVRADLVVDATGAWAGRLGREGRPLPLEPRRRHLFVTGPVSGVDRDLPFVWAEDAGYYFRPEGDGLLLSPCDETPWPPGLPPTDPAAAELLAEKLARHAPGFADLAVRNQWACLRTFAPDGRPLIGPDPDLPGLFHVSGLGGFGMMTSAAVGELSAALIAGTRPDWIDASLVVPSRPSASDRPGERGGSA